MRGHFHYRYLMFYVMFYRELEDFSLSCSQAGIFHKKKNMRKTKEVMDNKINPLWKDN